MSSAVQHQVGPYQLTELPGGDWTLMYVEDKEDLDSWDDLLMKFPEFGQATMCAEHALDIETGDGTETLVVSRWR